MEAAKYFELSANNGYIPGKLNLAIMLHNGEGIEKDSPRAVRLFKEIAKTGNEKGQYNWAIMLSEGIAVDPDPVKALKYFLRAKAGGVNCDDEISRLFVVEMERHTETI